MALVVTRLQLETVFAWLSTLGGAYSSLGEKFVEHVSLIFMQENKFDFSG